MEGCHQFLDLIPKQKEFHVKNGEKKLNFVSEEEKLELRLGPPGEQWTIKDNNINNSQTADKSFGYFSSSWLHLQSSVTVMNECSQPCSNRVALDHLQVSEKKAFLLPAPPANTAVPNSNNAQKRTGPAPVVGWPPIRSFRKNLASGTSSKSTSESGDDSNKESTLKPIENGPKSLFVKINMDGIPIGRKVDLKAYDSYEKLSRAVDQLFIGLLAAQNDAGDNEDGAKVARDILDGNDKYTLVYEDNEGDRMLVGDVPWNMFVSTVKRLRVLKSSELPMLSRGKKHGKAIPQCIT